MKLKCDSCNIKKTDYLLIKCRCGLKFCDKCKDTRIHNCSFNYFETNKELLEKNKVNLCNKIKKI